LLPTIGRVDRSGKLLALLANASNSVTFLLVRNPREAAFACTNQSFTLCYQTIYRTSLSVRIGQTTSADRERAPALEPAVDSTTRRYLCGSQHLRPDRWPPSAASAGYTKIKKKTLEQLCLNGLVRTAEKSVG
jgi:hypothetical protein